MICINKLPNFREFVGSVTLVPAYQGESVGLDLYNAGPDIYYTSETPLNTLIPTGIRVRIPSGYVGLLMERSSITKRQLKIRAGVIDPGYTGEVKVNAVLVGPSIDLIRQGDKLPFQLIVVAADSSYLEVDDDTYEEMMTDSKRAESGFGSTDDLQWKFPPKSLPENTLVATRETHVPYMPVGEEIFLGITYNCILGYDRSLSEM